MKAIPEDFKDILAGKANKLASVNFIAGELDRMDFTLSTKRRHILTNPTIYFFIRLPKVRGKIQIWNGPYRRMVIGAITAQFPNAYIVNASENGMLVAEFYDTGTTR